MPTKEIISRFIFFLALLSLVVFITLADFALPNKDKSEMYFAAGFCLLLCFGLSVILFTI